MAGPDKTPFRSRHADRTFRAAELPVVDRADGGAVDDRRAGLPDVLAVSDALHQLVESSDPAVVFADLARLCVPGLCDAAEVELLLDGRLAAWLEGPSLFADIPTLTDDQHGSAGQWTVTVHIPGSFGLPGASTTDLDYVAALTCRWRRNVRPTPTHVVLIKLLGRYAAAVVHQFQQAQHLRAKQKQIAMLQRAIDHHHQVGVAVGLRMARQQLTYEEALVAYQAAEHSGPSRPEKPRGPERGDSPPPTVTIPGQRRPSDLPTAIADRRQPE